MDTCQQVWACYCATPVATDFVLHGQTRQVCGTITPTEARLTIYNDATPFAEAEAVAAALQCFVLDNITLHIPDASSNLLSIVQASFPNVMVQRSRVVPPKTSAIVGLVRKICPKVWSAFCFEVRLTNDPTTIMATGGRFVLDNKYSCVETRLYYKEVVCPLWAIPQAMPLFSVEVMVCVMSKDVEQYVFEVLTLVRSWGCSTLAVSPHTSPIAHCLRHQIPFCAFVGRSDKTRRVLTLKRIADRVQQIFPLASKDMLPFIRPI